MGTDLSERIAHPAGEQPEVEEWSAVADTFGGRVHIEWDTTAPVTPLGQLPFFIEYLKQGGLFDGWVAGCPLSFTSPNAPRKRDVLGTLLLSVLAGHRRYAHVTALRCDAVNPPLLGMSKVVSEDALRRALAKIDEVAGAQWLQAHLDYCVRPLLDEPWVLDVDATIKPLYGHQERRGGRLQSAQTGAAVALLSHLHALGSATGAAGCGASRRSTQSHARRHRAVVIVGAARARALAELAAR